MNKLMNKYCYFVYFVFGNFVFWVKIMLAISTEYLLSSDLLVNII